MGRPRGWTRLYVRNWRVRTKLAAVLLVPSVAFLAVGGLELYTAFHASQAIDHYADRVALSREVTDLVHQLQQERDRTAGAVVVADRVGSESSAVGTMAIATADDRRLVNEAAASYRLVARPVGERLGGTFRTRVDEAAAALDEITALRTAADEGQLRNDAVFDGYSRLIASLLRVLPGSGTGGSGVSSAGVGSSGLGDEAALDESLRSLSDLVHAKELQSQVRGKLQGIAQVGGFSLGEYQEFADLRARRTAAVDRFRTETEPRRLSRYEDQVKGAAVLAADRLERTAADRSRLSALGFEAAQWWTASTNQLELIRGAERQLVEDAVDAAQRFSAAASQRASQVAAAVVAILLIALVTSLVVGRSMAGSLKRLRRRALVVAQRDLPEAIRRLNTPGQSNADLRIESVPVDSADEIGEVAEAFEAVHQSAVRLATDQAALRRDVSAMFINLARRSQVLVGRQLQLLDELEADEQDPDRLARFFVLDHLATRMRRNDENLLVLAASESHRLWREPVALYRLLLGAVAETEQYERIEASGPDDVVVPGHVVPDLMHLLAELLDNASTFSPPTTTVQLVARMVRSHAGTEAVVTIEDRGMGMTPSMLAEANDRLAQPAVIDVAVSERMGHFVVSHLAARHGMRVELRGAPGGGVTAVVTLPSALLTPVVGTSGPPTDGSSTGAAATGGAVRSSTDSGTSDEPQARPAAKLHEWTPEVSAETTQPLTFPILSSTDTNGAGTAGTPETAAAASDEPTGFDAAAATGHDRFLGADFSGAAVGGTDEARANGSSADGTEAAASNGVAAPRADAAEPNGATAHRAAATGSNGADLDGWPRYDEITAFEPPDSPVGDAGSTGNPASATPPTVASPDNPTAGGSGTGLPSRAPGSGLPTRAPGLNLPGNGSGAGSGLPGRLPGAALPAGEPGANSPAHSPSTVAPLDASEFDLPSRTTDAGLPGRARPTESGLPSRTAASPGMAGGDEVRGGSEPTGGWWSGDGSGWRSGMTRPPEPTIVETNQAGLPVRVPRAALPEPSTTTDSPTAAGLEPPSVPVADPDEVAEALARFHSGIRLADDEDAYPN